MCVGFDVEIVGGFGTARHLLFDLEFGSEGEFAGEGGFGLLGGGGRGVVGVGGGDLL